MSFKVIVSLSVIQLKVKAARQVEIWISFRLSWSQLYFHISWLSLICSIFENDKVQIYKLLMQFSNTTYRLEDKT